MKFNKKTTPTKVRNLAGGQAHKASDKLEFASILLTSFVQNQFYRSASDTIDRVAELISGFKDKEFAAKAAIYARNEFGMRSITHVVGGELFRMDGSKNPVAKQEWVKRFINKVVYRPDDAIEILAYFKNNVMDNAIPAQLKKGLALALSRFKEYELAKYRAEGKEISMVDVVNLTHPQHTTALSKLVKGTLKPANTWEVNISKAGQEAETEEEKQELKSEAWAKLIQENKIGYLALLRNLRNIIDQADDKTFEAAVDLLVNKEKIKKSLIMPFQFQTAAHEIEKIRGVKAKEVLVALSKALDISVDNVPHFEGKTLIALDESGSMEGKPLDIGSLFSAVLYKALDADLICFAESGKYVTLNPVDSTLTLAEKIKKQISGGTNFNAIFDTAKEKYDRIIILSDMQAWMSRGYGGESLPRSSFEAYKRRTGANPLIYSFDLQGYGTLQFPEQNVFALAGFSEKVFDIMKLLETDKKALINEIEKIEL